MIKYRLTLILSLIFTLCQAHNANEAFFTLKKGENTIEVQAEFPWTIRNALLDELPELEKTGDKTAFQHAFFNYIQNRFILKNEDQTSLDLLDVKEQETNGHSHHTNYVFVFKGQDVSTIENTIMFNISPNQKNYHTIEFYTPKDVFMTTPHNPEIHLAPKSQFLNYRTLIFILIGVGILAILFKRR